MIEDQINELASELSKIEGVQGVFLFGSYARKEAHEGSDIDIAVIFKDKKTSDAAFDEVIKVGSKFKFLHQIIRLGKDELLNLPLRRTLIKDGILLKSNNSETKESLLSMEVPIMPDTQHHLKAAKEKIRIVKRCFEEGDFSGVGDEAIKALEQIIEACVAREDIHFHDHPASAHEKRRAWLENRHLDLVHLWDLLWEAYGTLGYLAEDGELAKKTVEALNKLVDELSKREDLCL